MGIYLNPDSSKFEEAVNSDIYIDKTGLLIYTNSVLHTMQKYICISRPRRFGKSLNMDMLKAFFEIGTDKRLFDGLEISTEKQICEEYMGKFSVISVSLKDVEGNSFEEAKDMLETVISDEALRFQYLMDSPKLTLYEKARLEPLLTGRFEKTSQLTASLKTLSALLYKHTGTEVIILIDEYDVPLDKAYVNGYYEQMVQLIRSLFSQVLKTNRNLRFAVITGCLRISKESIFTGINNFTVHTVSDSDYGEYFGFTDQEVRGLLSYYEMEELYPVVKEWYDGYQFGKKAVYCPWDVISYCRNLCADPDAIPEDFWSNTSSNSIVSRFIDKANKQTRDEIENLISGETVIKEIKQELTYNELDKSIENLWSILFTTGYLTQRERIDSRKLRLAIPNREIKELFELQIREWFQEKSSEDVKKLDKLCMAFPDGDAETIEDLFNDYLWNTISIRDTAVKGRKENFYHGVLLGLLSHMENWAVWSNIESGEGYCDILLEVPENRVGVVIEMKYAQEDRMEAACTEALKQIEQRQYAARLKSDGMKNIVNYGIACYRKHCKVKIGKENS